MKLIQKESIMNIFDKAIDYQNEQEGTKEIIEYLQLLKSYINNTVPSIEI